MKVVRRSVVFDHNVHVHERFSHTSHVVGFVWMDAPKDLARYLSTREVFCCRNGSRSLVVDCFLYTNKLFGTGDEDVNEVRPERSASALTHATQLTAHASVGSVTGGGDGGDQSPVAGRNSTGPSERKLACFVLSHFHSDHYMGLRANFRHGPIFCSPVTARLVHSQLGVDPLRVHPVALNQRYRLDVATRTLVDRHRADMTAQQVDFMLVDANHCPGAAMIVFWTPKGVVLHTGDFRFSPPRLGGGPAPQPNGAVKKAAPTSGRGAKIGSALGPRVTAPRKRVVPGAAASVKYDTDGHPLQPVVGKVDMLYLDNTFCDDRYEFPTQAEAIQMSALYGREASKLAVQRTAPGELPSVLVLFGTYTIGKERIAFGCRDQLAAGAPILATPEKILLMRDCELLETGNFMPVPLREGHVVVASTGHAAPFTDSKGAQSLVKYTFAMAPMWNLTERHVRENEGRVALSDKADIDCKAFAAVMALTPTGWANRAAPGGAIKWVGHVGFATVPYSEHSSFGELVAFVKFIQPREIIPTVSLASYLKFETRFAEACPRMKRKNGLKTISQFFEPIPHCSHAPTTGGEVEEGPEAELGGKLNLADRSGRQEGRSNTSGPMALLTGTTSAPAPVAAGDAADVAAPSETAMVIEDSDGDDDVVACYIAAIEIE
jgi:hypothetical protein